MDGDYKYLLILFGIYLLIIVGVVVRTVVFSRKEKMRKPRTAGFVTGKEIVERMLEEAGVEGVTIQPQDAVVQRYYYNPGKQQIVLSANACYGGGYYEAVRAAKTAANVLQRQDGFGMIDLYLWLSPFVEWMARFLPMVLFFGLFFLSFSPLIIGVSVLAFWLLMFVFVLLMRPVDKDAARRGCEWIISHNIVDEQNRGELEKVGRYLANYNLWLVATAGFAMFMARWKWYSDKSV